MTGTPRTSLTRRTLLGAAGGTGLTALLAACTGGSGGPRGGGGPEEPQAAEAPQAATVVPDSLAMSQALLASAPAAVLVAPGSPYLATASSLGILLGLPVLAGGDADVAAECTRLGVGTVVAYDAAVPEGLDALAGPITAEEAGTLVGRPLARNRISEADVLDHLTSVGETTDMLLVTGQLDPVVLPEGTATTDSLDAAAPSQPSSVPVVRTGNTLADAPALATALGQGCPLTTFPSPDPRLSSEGVAAATEVADAAPIAIGSQFGDPDTFAARLATATTVPEVPGGGQIIFPRRRVVALYGHPGTGALGVLGEQGPAEAAARAAETAAPYEDLTPLPVVPAFEIIATIATQAAGADGDYSSETPVDELLPWVDVAEDEGLFVLLDLQPGRTDFLTQAQRYESLLARPHVGLALDPEWRLEPDQEHLEQIGSVSAAEVNTVITWLADLTAEHSLPQKLLVLHQFRTSMITERATLDTSRDELALVLHADGQGSQPAKQATWTNLQEGLPEGIHLAWKNFIDEDAPMLDPAQTMDIDPQPVLVSYQ